MLRNRSRLCENFLPHNSREVCLLFSRSNTIACASYVEECGSPAINRRLEHLQPLRDARVKSVLHVFFVAEKIGDGHFSA